MAVAVALPDGGGAGGERGSKERGEKIVRVGLRRDNNGWGIRSPSFFCEGREVRRYTRMVYCCTHTMFMLETANTGVHHSSGSDRYDHAIGALKVRPKASGTIPNINQFERKYRNK